VALVVAVDLALKRIKEKDVTLSPYARARRERERRARAEYLRREAQTDITAPRVRGKDKGPRRRKDLIDLLSRPMTPEMPKPPTPKSAEPTDVLEVVAMGTPYVD
jgi:hypothetical protein